MRYASIMAGGSGTRLWPLSTTARPKQLLRFIAGQSLLSISASRLMGLIDPANIFVCTSNNYTDQIHQELPFITPSQILGEPVGRDTLNAVGFSAAIIHKINPRASLAILTADHLITPVSAFQSVLRAAFDFVDQMPEYLVTFGITPTYAATGFGYLECGETLSAAARVVTAFKEKPNAEIAQQYLNDGRHYWNSGMFVWKTATILEQIRILAPASYEGLMAIAGSYGQPEFVDKVRQIYPTLPKISIDYAVMEKAPHVATMPMDVKWLDVGSWSSYAETITPDAAGNRSATADLLTLDATNILAVSDARHLVAVMGVNDLIVINAGNVTMICRADQSEKVKLLAQAVEKAYPDGYA